ncbi:hypothetical protein MASR1M107_25090 [Ignavibacteriales bacterium]
MKRLFLWLAFMSMITGGLFGSDPGGGKPPWKPVNWPEDDLLICELLLGRYSVSKEIAVYVTPKGIMLPLSAISDAMEIPIEVKPDEGLASGYLYEKSNSFDLDFKKGTATIFGKAISLDTVNAGATYEDIFIELNTFAAWFRWKIEFNRLDMRITVTPEKKLPIQMRWERESGTRPKQSTLSKTPSNFPVIENDFNFATLPQTDIRLSNSSTFKSNGSSSSISYTFLMSGDFMKMNGFIYHNGRDGSGEGVTNITLGRVDPDGELFGPVKATSFQIGNVALPGSMIFPSTGNAIGFRISNRPTYQPEYFNFQNIEGVLPAGWDVQLFRDSELIGYITSNAENRYLFKEIPLYFGMNNFRLVFYGPGGEVREENKSFNIGRNFIKPGETFYTLTLAGYRGDSRTYGKVDLGIMNELTLNLNSSAVDIQGERHYFAGVGANAFLGPVIISPQFAYDMNEKLLTFEAGLQTKVWGLSVNAGVTNFSPYQTGTQGTRSQAMKKRRTLAISGIDFGQKPLFSPISLQYQGSTSFLDLNEDIISVSSGLSVAGLNIGNTLRWRVNDYGSNFVEPALKYSATSSLALYGIMMQGSLEFGMSPEWFVNLIRISASKNLDDLTNLSGTIERNFRYDSYNLNLNAARRFGEFSLGVYAGYSSGNVVSMGLSFSTSLAIEPRGGNLNFSEKMDASFGLASIRVFIDANKNGIYDDGELPVKGVGFKVEGRDWDGLTSPLGLALLRGLSVGKYTEIEVNTASLPSSNYTVQLKGVQFVPRPGQALYIDFPVRMTSELSGMVYLLKDGTKKGAPGYVVELVDRQTNQVVKTERSAFDGFFNFFEVEVGKYLLRIKPAQKDKLELIDKSLIIDVKPNVEFLDGLELILEPVKK